MKTTALLCALLCILCDPASAVRTARWRFTQWSDGASELYDHAADAEETRDVSKSPEHAAVIAQLKERLRSLPSWPKTK